MGWKAVASLQEKDLKEKLGMPQKKEEPQKDEHDDAEQGSGQGSNNGNNGSGRDGSGNGGRQGGAGVGVGNGAGAGAGAPPNPDLNPDLDPDDPDLDPDLDPDNPEELSWSEKRKLASEERRRKREEKKAEKEAKKVARKVRKEEFKRAFRDKYKGDPGLLDRLALRFPRFGKLIGKDFSKLFEKEPSLDEQLAASLNSLSPEEREAKIKEGERLRELNRQAAEDFKAETEAINARKQMEAKLARRREFFTNNRGVIEQEQIQAGALMWIAEGIFSPDEVREMEVKEAMRKGKQATGKYLIPDLSDKEKSELSDRVVEQLDVITSKEIEERELSWLLLGIADKEFIENLKENTKAREEESAKRKERIAAKRKADIEAAKAGKQAGKTASLKEKINDGKNIPTPMPKSHGIDQSGIAVQIELVSDGHSGGGKAPSTSGASKDGKGER